MSSNNLASRKGGQPLGTTPTNKEQSKSPFKPFLLAVGKEAVQFFGHIVLGMMSGVAIGTLANVIFNENRQGDNQNVRTGCVVGGCVGLYCYWST